MDAAVATGRTVATLGLSMQRNVGLARELGLLRVPDHALRDITDLERLDPARVLIVCTGSQGEPRAALTQMAEGVSKWVEIGDRDTVIFSSHPIPGNEAAIVTVRNGLARRGARVLHTGNLDVHTSGHGKQQELKVLHSVASPEWFVPVHGEYEHLVAHARLATEMGMASERVVLCCDGDRVELTDDGVRLIGSVGGDHLYVDGTVGDLGSTVLSERRKLGEDGFVAVVVDIDLERGAVVRGPGGGSEVCRGDGWSIRPCWRTRPPSPTRSRPKSWMRSPTAAATCKPSRNWCCARPGARRGSEPAGGPSSSRWCTGTRPTATVPVVVGLLSAG